MHAKFYFNADSGGRVVYGVGLRPLAGNVGLNPAGSVEVCLL
jgi:hypothetical protein